ncbi:beta-galactosidase trimerization domain-containing protein [Tundrisphaera sp. TA3]|uniref:beta-galactosidase trimerization domain-containing protein n=1 Tax=Tundrisphaera sp. TA3 TaxID=3435775 RepID=UPI003EBA8076
MMRAPLLIAFVAAILPGPSPAAEPAADAYRHYIETAPEFRPVPPPKGPGRWDTWLYMPWRYRWTIGTNEAGGRFCREVGINGGFADRGEGPLDWLDRWNLRFYNDHTAGKGDLWLPAFPDRPRLQAIQRDPRAIRQGKDGPRPLDGAMRERLEAAIGRSIAGASKSPNRVAYALDDEISWGMFVTPIPWRINDDDAAYQAWLETYYGAGNAPRAAFVTPDFALGQLDRPLARIDFSPLLDRMTYNDSAWANLLGGLVEHANRLDPETPCGFVGGQAPNLWGGYDYAKLSKKSQFTEAYDLGSAQAILRSFDPSGDRPLVTSHFHNDKLGVANDIWHAWYYFAHGNRGIIGWVDESWFDGDRPRPWLEAFGPTLREIGAVQGPKLAGAKRVHDGVAIYYSHPSIQVGWCLDAEPHGKTWTNRNDDHRLGTSHNVRKAWEYLLADSGVQANFLAYDEVIRHGVPKEYRTLILPACYALSDAEAGRIAEFCRAGGTVVADFAPGLFDQHGKGRDRGALDDLFGVAHDGALTKTDFFGGKLWVEANQDAGYSAKTPRALLDTVACRQEGGFAVARPGQPTQVARPVGQGQAVYLNLSPWRYLQHRAERTDTDDHRAAFLRHILTDGRPPRVAVTAADGRRPRNIEATYWEKGGRLFVFLVRNLPTSVTQAGGGGAIGLAPSAADLAVELRWPARDAIDERTGRRLGDGSRFTFPFDGTSAVLFSVAAPGP